MNFTQLNIWAILAAAVSAFLTGGLWYSPVLFGNAWKRANGLKEGQDSGPSGAKVFVIAFALSL